VRRRRRRRRRCKIINEESIINNNNNIVIIIFENNKSTHRNVAMEGTLEECVYEKRVACVPRGVRAREMTPMN